MVKENWIIFHKNFELFNTNEQKMCNTYRQIFEIVYLLTIYEQNVIGSDHFNIALNYHKARFSCFTKN